MGWDFLNIAFYKRVFHLLFYNLLEQKKHIQFHNDRIQRTTSNDSDQESPQRETNLLPST